MIRFPQQYCVSVAAVFALGCSAGSADRDPTPGVTAGGAGGNGGSAGVSTSGGSAAGGATAGTSGSSGLGGSTPLGGTGGGGTAGSAGSSGSSGSSGSGGSGPTIVAACDELGAPGTWENVEPAAFHSPSNMQTIAVVVNPEDQSVFAAASNKTNGGDGSTGIYKSTDCGATWQAWNTGAGKEALATGQLWAMLIDPVAPENLYVANGYGSNPTLFKSTNGGVDFLPLQTDPAGQISFVQAVALDPANPQHLAVTYHDNCQSPRHSNCLSQSTDGGATWELFDGPSQVSGWHEAASLSILGADTYLYGCDSGVFRTTNGGGSWTEVIDSGIFGRYAGSAHATSDGTLYLGVPNEGVYSSTADSLGGVWSLIPSSPQPITNIVDDGVRLIGAQVNGPPFFSANLSSLGTWTHMDSPSVTSGSNQMAYDAAHHVVYSANFQSGLLRLVTQ